MKGIFLISISTFLIILFIARQMGEWLIVSDEPMNSDAMIILMGSISDRLYEAVDVYDSGYTKYIIIAEAANTIPMAYNDLISDEVAGTSEKFYNLLIKMNIPRDNVKMLHGNARSTLDEAMLVKGYTDFNPSFDTLMIVTSADHTRRAGLIFKKVFESSENSVKIIIVPSKYTDFNAKNWWKKENDIETVIMEYIKLFYFHLYQKWKIK